MTISKNNLNPTRQRPRSIADLEENKHLLDEMEDELGLAPGDIIIDPATKALVLARQSEVIKEAILKYAYQNAEKLGKQLVDRALNGSDQAMKEILERTLGKVKEDFNITAKIEQKVSVTDDRFNQIIQVRAKRIETPSQ